MRALRIKGLDNPNNLYIKVIENIAQMYYDCFPKTQFKIKSNKKSIHGLQKALHIPLNASENYMKNF